MLQVARLSPQLLGDSARLVIDFLHGQLNADGGFRDRAGRSDLYYTVFGMEAMMALRADLPHARIGQYVASFGDGEGLDLVHLGCLARCWANLPPELRMNAPREAIAQRIERHRSLDGGYHARPGAEHGTIYGCFLSMASYQDLQLEMPQPLRMLPCLEYLKADDGGYANQDEVPIGLTPPTAAAVTLLRHLQQPIDPALRDWLLSRHHPEGGFYASPMAPLPDLLSTATALHALAGMQADLEPVKEPCLDFIDSLWTNTGSFYGNWTEEALDSEYTYYGLLALGHLAV